VGPAEYPANVNLHACSLKSRAIVPLVCGGVIYALFAAACFHLAAIHDYEAGVSVGEGMFTLLGATALFAAVSRPGARALIVVVGTVPLVGWFIATPWNSGPPFLVASLVVPTIAAAAFLRQRQLRTRN
jgi:hypothetical protein